jgi:hypothetical protein
MNIRECKLCHEEKELDNLHFNYYNKAKLRFKYTCKVCENAQCRSYHANNRPKVLSRKKNYYVDNHERERERSREYSKTENGRKKNNARSLRNHNKKIATDICYKLRKRCSSAIWKALKNNNSSKANNSILDFLPYSMEELKVHIESFFESWMNWDNWGEYRVSKWNDNDSTTWKWQLDHIIPQSTFIYTTMDSDEFRKCWSLSNLRPFSAKANLEEGASRVRHKNSGNNIEQPIATNLTIEISESLTEMLANL